MEDPHNFDDLFKKISSKLDKKHKPKLAYHVVNGIAVVVTLVWAASFIADVLMSTYNPPAQIHMVMLGIVGSIFGFQIVHRTDEDE